MTFRRVYNVWGLLFSGAIATFVGFQLLQSIYFHVVSESWHPVAATVVAIENREKSAELRYACKFNGNEITGNTFCFLSTGTIDDKLLINGRYRVGDKIEVLVNPSNPNQSVVERRSLRFTYLWKQLLIVGFCGIMALHCRRKLRTTT